MKAWLAARDIAEARLPGLPATRQKASEWLSRAAERAPHLVQSRRPCPTTHREAVQHWMACKTCPFNPDRKDPKPCSA